MKTKFKNKLRYVAAGIFLLGLMANVSLSLTDPFVHVGAELLAQATSGNTGPCSTSWTSTSTSQECGGEPVLIKIVFTYTCNIGVGGQCKSGTQTKTIVLKPDCTEKSSTISGTVTTTQC